MMHLGRDQPSPGGLVRQAPRVPPYLNIRIHSRYPQFIFFNKNR